MVSRCSLIQAACSKTLSAKGSDKDDEAEKEDDADKDDPADKENSPEIVEEHDDAPPPPTAYHDDEEEPAVPAWQRFQNHDEEEGFEEL